MSKSTHFIGQPLLGQLLFLLTNQMYIVSVKNMVVSAI